VSRKREEELHVKKMEERAGMSMSIIFEKDELRKKDESGQQEEESPVPTERG
jgi:hypothetical protein